MEEKKIYVRNTRTNEIGEVVGDGTSELLLIKVHRGSDWKGTMWRRSLTEPYDPQKV